LSESPAESLKPDTVEADIEIHEQAESPETIQELKSEIENLRRRKWDLIIECGNERDSAKKAQEEVALLTARLARRTEELESANTTNEAGFRRLSKKDFEISELNSELRARDRIIAEADEQISRLESEIASAEKSATTGTELPEIGELQSQLSDLKQDSVPASDLTNKTKAICKLVNPWVSAKYVENLNAQIKKEMERK